MKKTIIITEGTSAKAQEQTRKYPDAEIIFADSRPVPALLIKMGKYIQLPAPEASTFIHELLKSCLDHNATALVLLSEEERRTVEPQKMLFEEFNIQLI